MAFCTHCGHQLGIGRFCTNCGHPTPEHAELLADLRTDTSERSLPVVPPPDMASPRPLFADEVDPPLPAPAPAGHREPRRSLGWLPLTVIAGAIVLLALVGGWLLFGGSDDEADRATDTPPVAQTPADPDEEDAQEAPDDDDAPVAPPAEPVDLTAAISVDVPATAPPTQSLSGDPVTFAASNLFDGDASTAWRMPGDGSGSVLRLRLPEESVITQVGLINGYAKVDTGPGGGTVRWYRQNRRVQQVTWVFDDGTQVVQRLEATEDLQTIDIDPLVTTTIRLRIRQVSAPGTGPRGRDFTPISEISVLGGPAS